MWGKAAARSARWHGRNWNRTLSAQICRVAQCIPSASDVVG
jgi:hypothetical protein